MQLFDQSGVLADYIYWNGLFLVSQIQAVAFQKIPADLSRFLIAIFLKNLVSTKRSYWMLVWVFVIFLTNLKLSVHSSSTEV